MKTIGLLGGMSWHSTAKYYQMLNEGVQQRLGGYHSARILMSSVEFDEIHRLQHEDRWDEAGQILAEQALRLQQAGADFLLIATNTMHISVPIIEQNIDMPILHIADATADAIMASDYDSCGLLGTRFTMHRDYYKRRLHERGLRVLVPDEQDQLMVNGVIFEELCFGRLLEDSRRQYLRIMQQLMDRGAKCVIEGCTEIALLVQQGDTAIPLFDTTAIHARAALDYALAD